MGDAEIEDKEANDEDDDADSKDEDTDIEVDWGCLTETCWWGMDGLDTERCQSTLSPEGLFRMVGRTSSRLLYAFVRFSAL